LILLGVDALTNWCFTDVVCGYKSDKH